MVLIKDTGGVFEIDPLKRSVGVPQNHKIIGTEGENISEQITFKCPQVIDGVNIVERDLHFVAWANAVGGKGHDGLNIDRVEDGFIYFTWTVRDGLTVTSGLVQFSIHFEDLPADDTDIPYRWGTTICKDCRILESLNALIGTYKSMYVVGDTLVISDYTPVTDRTLDIGMAGIVPSGNIEITENGVHDVANFAVATVNIEFEDPHDLTNLTPENVKKGVNINGVIGDYGGYRETRITINNNSSSSIKIVCSRLSDEGNIIKSSVSTISSGSTSKDIYNAQEGLLVIYSENSAIAHEVVDDSYGTDDVGVTVISFCNNMIVFQVQGDKQRIDIYDRKG